MQNVLSQLYAKGKELGIKNPVCICTGKYAKSYHYNINCDGLNSCKAEKQIVEVDDAIQDGRHLCNRCKKYAPLI